MTKPTNATWIEVDLNAIKNNIQLISKSTNSAVMAVVKANGYGHGIVEVAKASESAGVAWLGVAMIDEAKQIREAGVMTDILVLGHTSSDDIPLAKVLPPNSGISYVFAYDTKKYERVGTISVGYGDGFRRVSNNEVLVRGKRVPVIGNVCMDQCVVSLENVPDACPGDEVVLIGKQSNEVMSAENVAIRWNTIVYEPICGLTNRIPRIYDRKSGV